MLGPPLELVHSLWEILNPPLRRYSFHSIVTFYTKLYYLPILFFGGISCNLIGLEASHDSLILRDITKLGNITLYWRISGV